MCIRDRLDSVKEKKEWKKIVITVSERYATKSTFSTSVKLFTSPDTMAVDFKSLNIISLQHYKTAIKFLRCLSKQVRIR